MSEEASHTPTPWAVATEKGSDNFAHSIYGSAGDYKALLIARVDQNDSHDDAPFIVRAVNAHDALVKALISLHDATVDLLGDEAEHDPVIARARAALELARDMPGAPR